MAGKIEFRYLGNANLMKKVKGFRPAAKRALQNYIYTWHRKYLPRHFILSAYEIYPNVIRKRYRARKKYEYMEDVRLHGIAHARSAAAREARGKLREPMRKTGNLRRNVTRKIRAQGTASRVKGILPGSQVANFHQATGQHGYNMPAELRHINDQEKVVLAGQVEAELIAWLDEHEPEHRVKFPIPG